MNNKIKMIIEIRVESEDPSVQKLRNAGYSLDQINDAINISYNKNLKETADYLRCSVSDIKKFKIKCVESK